jgi:hypothetical protein
MRFWLEGMMAASGDERTGSLGFESKLWEAADLLRNNMDPAEHKHVVLAPRKDLAKAPISVWCG